MINRPLDGIPGTIAVTAQDLEIYLVSSIEFFTNYNPLLRTNDLAKLHLKKKIKFNSLVAPAVFGFVPTPGSQVLKVCDYPLKKIDVDLIPLGTCQNDWGFPARYLIDGTKHCLLEDADVSSDVCIMYIIN